MFKVLEIKPMFNAIITTANVYSEDVRSESGLYLGTTKMAGAMNPYQTVVAVGSTVRDIKTGDIVYLSFKRYEMPNHIPGRIEDNIQKDNLNSTYEIPCVEIDGKKYLRLFDNDVQYIVTKFEGVEDGGLLE